MQQATRHAAAEGTRDTWRSAPWRSVPGADVKFMGRGQVELRAVGAVHAPAVAAVVDALDQLVVVCL